MILQISMLIFAYLIGLIPTALWVARWMMAVDIRWVGDGNMGAVNTGRTLNLLGTATHFHSWGAVPNSSCSGKM